MNKCKCSICGKEGFGGFVGYVIDGVYVEFCPEHKSQAPVTKGHRGIYDATGKPRDRFWLNKKLDMTRTDKKWNEDIKSRKMLVDGSVGRFKGGKRVG